MNPDAHLEISTTRRLAYHRLRAKGDDANLPGVIFLGGFKSDMTGNKAVWLEERAKVLGNAYVRFDYRGHGQSTGAFEDGCIGDWADDAAEVLHRLTNGPQIVIGSSMGGWIALLLAKRFPERICGLIGIAAAPDFTEDSLPHRLKPDQKAELEAAGRLALPSAYSNEPYVITRKLLQDGRTHLVLRDRLKLPMPVRLLHGTADPDVDPAVSVRLLDHIDSPDARLTLIKGADHRFSSPAELTILGHSLDDVLTKVRENEIG